MDSPSFKDILNNDIKAIFLNPEEFGETHTVQGKEMTIVLDDMENIEREKKMKSHMDGIYARQMLFYVSADDFGPMPAQGGLITIDRNRYTVVDATDEAGMYAITVEANRSHR
jgi:hypothetical protein